jgi:hypothetical protein
MLWTRRALVGTAHRTSNELTLGFPNFRERFFHRPQ